MVTESLFRRKGNPLSRCEPVESSTEDLTEPQVSHIAKAGIESEIGEDQVRIYNFIDGPRPDRSGIPRRISSSAKRTDSDAEAHLNRIAVKTAYGACQ